jgi:hypothetical protein
MCTGKLICGLTGARAGSELQVVDLCRHCRGGEPLPRPTRLDKLCGVEKEWRSPDRMWLQGREIRGRKTRRCGAVASHTGPVLNRLCHKGPPIKFTTLLLKDCKTRGSSRQNLEWKLTVEGRLDEVELETGEQKKLQFHLKQTASRISYLANMATDSLNVHKRQCMQQREVPSIFSFQDRIACPCRCLCNSDGGVFTK